MEGKMPPPLSLMCKLSLEELSSGSQSSRQSIWAVPSSLCSPHIAGSIYRLMKQGVQSMAQDRGDTG